MFSSCCYTLLKHSVEACEAAAMIMKPSLYEHDKMEQSTSKGNSRDHILTDQIAICIEQMIKHLLDSGRSVTARAKSL